MMILIIRASCTMLTLWFNCCCCAKFYVYDKNHHIIQILYVEYQNHSLQTLELFFAFLHNKNGHSHWATEKSKWSLHQMHSKIIYHETSRIIWILLSFHWRIGLTMLRQRTDKQYSIDAFFSSLLKYSFIL